MLFYQTILNEIQLTKFTSSIQSIIIIISHRVKNDHRLQLINIMFVHKNFDHQSPQRKRLKFIAQLAHYQPTPSIPSPSMGFNYTLSQPRYSQSQTPRVIRRNNKVFGASSEDLKLSTILQSQNPNHLFPRIIRHSQKQPPSLKKAKRLLTHITKDRQSTQATRERSLTHDNSVTIDQESLINAEFNRKKPIQQRLKQQKIGANIIRSTAQIKQKESFIYAPSIRQDSQYEDQSESQYSKNAVPGPGYYNYSYSDFDKKSIGNRSTKPSFISQSNRFPQIKIKDEINQSIPNNSLEIEKEKRRQSRIKRMKSKNKMVPFNSQSPRSFQVQNTTIKPGPQDYSPRIGLEEELIRRIQRNFKGTFGSSEQRLKNLKDSPLGPGYYDVPSPSQFTEGQNYYFKSNNSRFGL